MISHLESPLQWLTKDGARMESVQSGALSKVHRFRDDVRFPPRPTAVPADDRGSASCHEQKRTIRGQETGHEGSGPERMIRPTGGAASDAPTRLPPPVKCP
jgi:hypothetical protein